MSIQGWPSQLGRYKEEAGLLREVVVEAEGKNERGEVEEVEVTLDNAGCEEPKDGERREGRAWRGRESLG